MWRRQSAVERRQPRRYRGAWALGSRELPEAALCDHPGTLIVVSHDEVFVENIGVEQTPTL